MKSFKYFWSIILIISTITIIFYGCGPSTFELSSSVTPQGGGTISPSSGTFKKGSEITLVATPSRNYEFIGWAGEVAGNTNPLSIKMDTDKQIVAQFSKMTYSVNINTTPSTGGSIYPESGMFDSGDQVKFTATANKGYRFDHWSGGLTGEAESSTLTINSNQSITAHFVKVYSLSISVPIDLGANMNQGSGVYDEGTKITLETIPTMYPYSFDRWSGTDNDIVNPTVVTMNSDKTVNLYYREYIASPTVEDTQNVWGGGVISIPIDLERYEWVQGEFWGPYFQVTIQDPTGNVIYNGNSSFTFNAKIPGRYIIGLYNSNTIMSAAYRLSYTIYH